MAKTKKSTTKSPFEEYFTWSVIDSIVSPQKALNSLLNISGYRKKRVKKYLHVWLPTISKSYDDYEYAVGSLKGLLLSFRRVNTHIPIGTEVIEVPVYSKPKKGSTIKFRRYGELKK